MSMFRRKYTTAHWHSLADDLREHAGVCARRGRSMESRELHRLGREIIANLTIGRGVMYFLPGDRHRIDAAYDRLWGVPEVPSEDVAEARAAVAFADQFVRGHCS